MFNKSNMNQYFIILLIICAINFFDLQMIKGSAVRYIQFGILLYAIAISLPHIFSRSTGFVLPVQLIFFSVFLSMFVATVSREQPFVDSLIGSTPVLLWCTFFYLLKIDFSIKKVETIIICYAILYLILYFFQFTHPQNNYFIDLEMLDDSRGILRIVFPGRGLFYLAIFIAITKLTTTCRHYLFWSLLTTIGLIVTVMQVTRQFIFGTIIIYVIHFTKGLSLLKKVSFGIGIVMLIIFISQLDNSIVKGLWDTNEQTQDSGTDYVRIQAAEFFINDFSALTLHRIVGNGVPYGSDSTYYHFYKFYVDNYGFWLSDVGLVAVYTMFGVIAVIGYLLIWVKSFMYPLPESYQYLKYYLWFLLITSFTSDTIYSPNDLIVTVLVVYMYQILYKKTMRVDLIRPIQISHV